MPGKPIPPVLTAISDEFGGPIPLGGYAKVGGDEIGRVLIESIGDSPAMRQLRKTIAEVALSDVTVLIEGESGAGKELVAQALHAASARRSEPFVPVDCCTLQESHHPTGTRTQDRRQDRTHDHAC